MLTVSVAAPSHQHLSVFHLVSVLQQDAALAETLILQDARGQAPAKRQRRAVQLHQRRLQQLCFNVRDDRKTVPETLNALGHCVRLFLSNCYDRTLDSCDTTIFAFAVL